MAGADQETRSSWSHWVISNASFAAAATVTAATWLFEELVQLWQTSPVGALCATLVVLALLYISGVWLVDWTFIAYRVLAGGPNYGHIQNADSQLFLPAEQWPGQYRVSFPPPHLRARTLRLQKVAQRLAAARAIVQPALELDRAGFNRLLSRLRNDRNADEPTTPVLSPETECIVCGGGNLIVEQSCGHASLCSECHETWQQRKPECPMCRARSLPNTY